MALNLLTATVLVRGHNNSTFYYTRFSGARAEEELQLERMLRDIFGGVNTSSSFVHSRQKRASRFIHYDYSDNAVNVGYS